MRVPVTIAERSMCVRSHSNVYALEKNKVSNVKEDQRNRFLVWSILILIMLIAIVLRIYHLQFYMDNGGYDSMYYLRGAVKFSTEGWFSLNSEPKGSLFTSFLSIFLGAFGSNFFASKMVSLISGSLLPLFVFLLGSELFNRKVGILSALIVSINPLLILYSDLVFREALFSLLWTSCLYFTLVGLKGKKFHSIIGGILFALSSVTIPVGIFAAIGFVSFFFLRIVFRPKKCSIVEYKNLGLFFAGAFLALFPFLVRNYVAFNEPLIEWAEAFGGSLLYVLWIYVGIMGLSVVYVLLSPRTRSRLFVYPINFKSLSSSISKNYKFIRISIITLVGILASVIVLYEFLEGPGVFAKIFVGFLKLLETLITSEALGFLSIFSFLVILYALFSFHEATLGVFALVFCVSGLALGITAHYMVFQGLSFDQVLTFSPIWPMDNAFRYVSSYIPFLTILASYGIYQITEKISSTIARKRNHLNHLLKLAITSFFIIAIILQFTLANESVVVRTQRTSNDLEMNYSPVLQWLYAEGSPIVYSFNSMWQDYYGVDKVVVLDRNEGLMDIAERASREKIEYIIVDIFGEYADPYISLFLGGLTDDTSFYRLQSFELIKSYKIWPMVQIFKISQIEVSQTALVIQHDNSGEDWVNFLSKKYFVFVVDDEEDLTSHFSGDYKLIVLSDLRRTLTNDELNSLREKVADGIKLVVNGLSPAYLQLGTNAYWIGATDFVEAPKDSKWSVEFTDYATRISQEIELDRDYALYSSSSYSSPTGLIGLEEDVVVYATRVEDKSAVIYTKPHINGIVIFSGVRPFYGVTTSDYTTYLNFIEKLIN